MKFSVVFSFYNEESNIPETIRRTRETCRKIGFQAGEYEIIFVNDNSKDRSKEIVLQEIAASRGSSPESLSDIKLVNTTRNFGNAACILAGFAFASGEYVGYLDCDLQDPPEMLEQLYLLARKEQVDIVHTKRTKRHGENKIKLFITKIGYAILGYSMDTPIQSNVGDFKVLSRRVVKTLLQMHEPLPFIRGMVAYVGFSERTVEYERSARYGGDTQFPVLGRRVISNFINNALIGYSDLPLYTILLGSVAGMILAVALSAYAVYNKFNGFAVPGTTGILIVISVFSSLILFSIGILGLYLSSIKKAVLKRPTYLIESTQGFTSNNIGNTIKP